MRLAPIKNISDIKFCKAGSELYTQSECVFYVGNFSSEDHALKILNQSLVYLLYAPTAATRVIIFSFIPVKGVSLQSTPLIFEWAYFSYILILLKQFRQNQNLILQQDSNSDRSNRRRARRP